MGYLTQADGLNLSWPCLPTCTRSRQISDCYYSSRGLLYHPSCSMPPKHLFPLCDNHQLHQPRERLTADPPRRCAGKSTRTITKLESEAERGRGQTLIMARPWLDMLWKVTVDESSIIYSSAELDYLFFQQHEQQGIMAQNKQPVVAYSCDCQQTAGRAQWWLKLWPASRTGFTLTLLTLSLSLSLSLSHVTDMWGQCQLWTGQSHVAACL